MVCVTLGSVVAGRLSQGGVEVPVLVENLVCLLLGTPLGATAVALLRLSIFELLNPERLV